jgi:predicted RNA-binding Zn-ribbon protein involved in translation (DUF1610 family)
VNEAPPPPPLPPAPPAVAAGARQFPCRTCGANVEFHPGSAALKCPYCGAVEEVPETADRVDEHCFESALARPRKPLGRLGPKAVRCRGCGASSETTAVADACPFCGAATVPESDPEELIAPEAVLPFGFPRGKATDLFRGWLASRWFAPSDLKSLAAEDGIKGVYVPFWTFDCFARTFYTGQRGEYYYVTVTETVMVNGKPQMRTRQVRHTRWYPASGRVERTFDDVLVPAVKSLPADELAKLEPWDLGGLKPYAPEFVAGFLATRYETDLAHGFDAARAIMTETIREDCRRDIGGDEQRVDAMKTSWNAVTFKHVLLPVWSAAYAYRNRTWRVLINARTGEVIGQRPYSFAKIAGLVLLVAAVAAAIAVVAQSR